MLQCVVVCCSECHNYSASLHGKCLSGSCSVLQWVAMCCSVLQYVALDCNVLQCVKANTPSEYSIHSFHPFLFTARQAPFSVLQCIAMCCSVLQWNPQPFLFTARQVPLLFSLLSSLPLSLPPPPPLLHLSLFLFHAPVFSLSPSFSRPFSLQPPAPPSLFAVFSSRSIFLASVCVIIYPTPNPHPHTLSHSLPRVHSLSHIRVHILPSSVALFLYPSVPLLHTLFLTRSLSVSLSHAPSRTCTHAHAHAHMCANAHF